MFLLVTMEVVTAVVATCVAAPVVLATWVVRKQAAAKNHVRSGRQEGICVPHSFPVELHHWGGSLCSQKVRLCLAEKGVTYASRIVRLSEEGHYDNLSDEFLKVNPNGTVPALVHDGVPVLESHDIIRYIDSELSSTHSNNCRLDPRTELCDRWCERGSLPSGGPPSKHELHRFTGIAIGLLSQPSIVGCGLSTITTIDLLWALFRHPQPMRVVLRFVQRFMGMALPDWKMRQALEAVEFALDDMEEQLGRTQFLAGDEYSLADVTWTANLSRLSDLGYGPLLIHPRTHVRNYWDRMQARQSFKEAIVFHRVPIMQQWLHKNVPVGQKARL